MGSARAELARRVLETLAQNSPVTFHDVIQLRSWAVRPEDAVQPLEKIARGILDQEENQKTRAAESGQ